ncbi:ABC transporter transmembrane domain-containing protein [Streptococcus ferus]|uniref:ABC transporter transmembrane domain-containing protein n=1 Tax=Streptococcus ferus TaxID=1345 RepID=UPI0035A07D82
MLRDILRKKITFIAIITLLIVIEVILSIPLPYISKYLIDVVIGLKKYELVWGVFLVLLVMLSSQLLIGNILVRTVAEFETDLITECRKKIVKAVIEKKEIREENKSNIQEVLLNDVEAFFSNITEAFYIVLSNILKIVGCLIIIFYINYKLAIMSLVLIPLYIVWTIYVSQKLKQMTYTIKESREGIIRTTNNILNNLLLIKLYDLFNITYNSYKKSLVSNASVLKKIRSYMNFISIVSNLIITVATILPLLLGVGLIAKSLISLGDLIAFNVYIGMLFSPVTSLISVITTLKLNSVYKERIFQYLSPIERGELNKLSSQTNYNTLDIVNYALSISGRTLLKNVNLNFASGMVIKIEGDNGCGKSLFLKSFINLINYSGDIIFNDVSLKNKHTEELNDEIIYVSNTLNFVDGNLFDNIPINKNTDRIFEILDIKKFFTARVLNSNSEFIQGTLSSGEIQKLKIARGLNRAPRVLLLDEMFSHITKKDSDRILANIIDEFPNIIIILVEHHYESNLVSQTYKFNNGNLIKTE